MIPKDAVEAMAEAMYEDFRLAYNGRFQNTPVWEYLNCDQQDDWRRHARVAYPAAAPFLRAQALEDAADMKFKDGSWVFGLPARQKLRARAFTERERK